MGRERETLNRSVIRTDEKTKKQEAVTKVYELDKAREKYGIELSLVNSKHMAAQEELKNRDNKISELKKNLGDVKGKLAQQKQLYEAVRTERNIHSKNLVESQDEIAEMKRKFKIMQHQTEQLKEENDEKEKELKQE